MEARVLAEFELTRMWIMDVLGPELGMSLCCCGVDRGGATWEPGFASWSADFHSPSPNQPSSLDPWSALVHVLLVAVTMQSDWPQGAAAPQPCLWYLILLV